MDISQQQTCTSLVDYTLQEWQQMDVAQIKNTFVPACAVKRQFRGKLKFLLNIKASLENNQNFAEVEGHHLSYTARPDWGDELPVCIFCQTPINFIKALTNFFADVPRHDNLNLTSFAICLSKLMIPFAAFSKS